MAENEGSKEDPFLQPEGAESPQEGGEQEQQAGLSQAPAAGGLPADAARGHRPFVPALRPPQRGHLAFIALLLDAVRVAARGRGTPDARRPALRDRVRGRGRVPEPRPRSQPGLPPVSRRRALAALPAGLRLGGARQAPGDPLDPLHGREPARGRRGDAPVEGALPTTSRSSRSKASCPTTTRTAGADARWSEVLALPDDVDLPRPDAADAGRLRLGPRVRRALERLRGEASAAHVPEDCVALLLRLREQLGDAVGQAGVCRGHAPVHRGARLPALREQPQRLKSYIGFSGGLRAKRRRRGTRTPRCTLRVARELRRPARGRRLLRSVAPGAQAQPRAAGRPGPGLPRSLRRRRRRARRGARVRRGRWPGRSSSTTARAASTCSRSASKRRPESWPRTCCA